MQVTVYGWRVSPFVDKVIRGVERKGLAWKLVVPKSPGDMRRWSPQTGKIPAADVDGEQIFDSTFILRRLDELVPNPPLVSSDPVTAAHQRLLEDWADDALYWYVMAFRWAPQNALATAGRILDVISAPSSLRPLIARVMRRTVRKQIAAQGTAAQGPGRPPSHSARQQRAIKPAIAPSRYAMIRAGQPWQHRVFLQHRVRPQIGKRWQACEFDSWEVATLSEAAADSRLAFSLSRVVSAASLTAERRR
jgi:glutathione S-transferase